MSLIPGIEEIEVTNEVLAELGFPPVDLSKADKRQPSDLFVKGPISFGWLARINVAANAVLIAQVIKALVDTEGREPITIPSEVWVLLKLPRQARKRALDALEHAGIIRTERPPGRATRIWLLNKPQVSR